MLASADSLRAVTSEIKAAKELPCISGCCLLFGISKDGVYFGFAIKKICVLKIN